MKLFSLILLLLTGLPAVFAAEADADGFIQIVPQDIRYEGGGPAEPSRQVLIGDPSQEGFYLLRARFAPGVMTYPHYHTQDRHVTVISGTWYAGTGREFDTDDVTPLGPGSYMYHPAGALHYDGSKGGEVIVEIKGMGPVETVRFGPE